MSTRSIVVENHDFTYRVGRTRVAIRRKSDGTGWNAMAYDVKGWAPGNFVPGINAVMPGDVARWIREEVFGLDCWKPVDWKPE